MGQSWISSFGHQTHSKARRDSIYLDRLYRVSSYVNSRGATSSAPLADYAYHRTRLGCPQLAASFVLTHCTGPLALTSRVSDPTGAGGDEGIGHSRPTRRSPAAAPA